MDSDFCEHLETKDGVCIHCGQCLESEKFENEWARATPSYTLGQHMRYAIKDQEKSMEKAALKILLPLRLESYKTQVQKILREKIFKTRLKPEDKVIVVLYHLLKEDSFPISLSDLLSYTTLTKYKVLKAHRDAFGFQKITNEYLRGIFDRTVSFLSKFDIKVSCKFEKFLFFTRTFVSSDPKALCLALLLEYTESGYQKIKDTTEYNIQQIRNIRRKIRNNNRTKLKEDDKG